MLFDGFVGYFADVDDRAALLAARCQSIALQRQTMRREYIMCMCAGYMAAQQVYRGGIGCDWWKDMREREEAFGRAEVSITGNHSPAGSVNGIFESARCV